MVLRKLKLILFFVFLVAFTIFFGAGCKSKVPPQDLAGQPEQEAEATPQADAGAEGEVEPEPRADSGVSKPDAGADASVIPEGWQIYRNPDWGIERLAYPEGWHYAELPPEVVGDANVHAVVFNTTEFEPLLYSDPVYPLTMEVRRNSSVEEEIQLVQNLRGREDRAIGVIPFTILYYQNELVDRDEVSFMVEVKNAVYSISGFADLPEIETIAATLQVEAMP